MKNEQFKVSGIIKKMPKSGQNNKVIKMENFTKKLSVISNAKKHPKFNYDDPIESEHHTHSSNNIDNSNGVIIPNKHNNYNDNSLIMKQIGLLNCELDDIQTENNILNTKIANMTNNIIQFHTTNDSLNTKLNNLDNRLTQINNTMTSLNLYQNSSPINISLKNLNINMQSVCYAFNNIMCIDNAMRLSNIKFMDTNGAITFDKNFDLTQKDFFGTLCIYCTDNGSIYNGIITKTLAGVYYTISNRPLLPLGISLNGFIIISLKIISIN